MLDVLRFIQLQVSAALERGPGAGFITPKDAITENRWWIIETLSLALQRYASLWEAALLMSAYGLYIDPYKDLIDTDCCYAHVPRSMALAVGPEDQWLLTYCELCSEGQEWLHSPLV